MRRATATPPEPNRGAIMLGGSMEKTIEVSHSPGPPGPWPDLPVTGLFFPYGANGDRSNIEPVRKRSTGSGPTRFMRLESTKLCRFVAVGYFHYLTCPQRTFSWCMCLCSAETSDNERRSKIE